MSREESGYPGEEEEDDTRLDGALERAFGGAAARPDETVTLAEPGAAFRTPGRELLRVLPQERAGGASRYEIHGEIGRGGMGQVLRGRDVDLGRDVAIKVLDAQLASQPGLARRLVEEAQIAGQLQHPGVVPVYEVGLLEDRRPFFSMKLVGGRTLRDILQERENTAGDLASLTAVFERICQTMAYAHARGVIHRDLKPANVMVGAFGEVQVMDWGLAKVAGQPRGPEDGVRTPSARRGQGHSESGDVIGTPAYMAPEQARGEVDSLGPATDVFGLGAILCEMLTGRPPYEALSVAQAREQAAAGLVTAALRRIEDAVADRELKDLAARCLAPRKEDRPPDAGAVAAAVTAWRAGTEERARAAELEAAAARARARSEARARRLTFGLAAAALVAVAFAGWALISESDRRARVADATRRAEAALSDARLSARDAAAEEPDPALWARPVAAARRAVELSETVEVEPAVRAEAGDLLARYVAEEEAARHRRAELDRDRRTGAQLEGVAAMVTTLKDRAARDGAYARVFEEYGLDLDSLEVEEAASAVRASGLCPQLVQALDGWALVRRDEGREGWKKLSRIAGLADADLWRGAVRRAWELDDRDALRRAALEPSLGIQPPRALELLAESLVSLDDRTTAVEVLRRGQVTWPADFGLSFLLGLRLLESKDPATFPAVVRFMASAAALRPDSWPAWMHLGYGLERLGDEEGALACYRKAVALGPGYLENRQSLANHLRRTGALDEALELARVLVEDWPQDAELRNVLGVVQLAKSAPGPAAEAFREAHALQPDNVSYSINLAIALGRSGRPDEALATYEDALTHGEDDASLHFNRAIDLLDRGRVAEGVDGLRRAAALDPGDSGARSTLALLLLAAADPETEAMAREAARLDPTDPRPVGLLGEALLAQGRPREALLCFREVGRLGGPRFQAAIADHVATAERMAGLETRYLAPLMMAELAPPSRDVLPLAHLALGRGWDRLAARLWLRAVEDDLAGPDDLLPAARAAARSATASWQVPAERLAWSLRARHWITQLADHTEKTWDAAHPREPAGVLWGIRHAPDLAPLFDPAPDLLPEDERAAWISLTSHLDQLLARLRTPN